MFHHVMRGIPKPTPLKPYMMIIWSDPSMFHDAVSPWSLHMYDYEAVQGQWPHFPPTRKATIHIHRGEGGERGQDGYITLGGGGGWGGACQTWIIYIYIYTPRVPFWPLFLKVNPPKQGLNSYQNKGHQRVPRSLPLTHQAFFAAQVVIGNICEKYAL